MNALSYQIDNIWKLLLLAAASAHIPFVLGSAFNEVFFKAPVAVFENLVYKGKHGDSILSMILHPHQHHGLTETKSAGGFPSQPATANSNDRFTGLLLVAR